MEPSLFGLQFEAPSYFAYRLILRACFRASVALFGYVSSLLHHYVYQIRFFQHSPAFLIAYPPLTHNYDCLSDSLLGLRIRLVGFR